VLVFIQTFAYPVVCDAGGAIWRDAKHSRQLKLDRVRFRQGRVLEEYGLLA
jgi:hypothetical protein